MGDLWDLPGTCFGQSGWDEAWGAGVDGLYGGWDDDWEFLSDEDKNGLKPIIFYLLMHFYSKCHEDQRINPTNDLSIFYINFCPCAFCY
jgi:hypothetical protein